MNFPNYDEDNSLAMMSKIETCAKNIEQSFNLTLDNAKTELIRLTNELESSELKSRLDFAFLEYDKSLENLEGFNIDDYKEIESKRQGFIRELQDLEILKPLEEKLIADIRSYLFLLNSQRNELFNLRKEVIEDVENKAENIGLTIHPMSHGNRWLAQLRKNLGREDRFGIEFETLKSWLYPDNKLDLEKWGYWCEFLLINDRTRIKEIMKNNERELFVDKFGKMWDDRYQEKTLSSIFVIQPEDRIQINIKMNNDEIGIHDGSPGQKCAAILAFIMNQGTKPLIIDQPEDDLDNSLILDLIVKNVSKMKHSRQIIIVTHNPNIPVLGDAEGIIILDRNPDGKVIFKFGKKTGCIEEKKIKEGICDIMEGGFEAFKKRKAKYESIYKGTF